MVDVKEVKAVGSTVADLAAEIDSDKTPLLKVAGISKSYKEKLVIKDVSFDVFSGDIFGVIGMSGSGKTTLFQLMAGFLRADAGDILVKSRLLMKKGKNVPTYLSVFKNNNAVKKNFGFAAQIPSFYDHLTIEENLFFYSSLYNIPKKKALETITHLLKLVDLTSEKDTLASELSGGMQRRLDIACSLIHNPKFLLLDEPTSDLDPVMRKQIWALIKEINANGTTIFLSSHILEEVENLCTKVAILHDKRILGYGTLKELRGLFKRNKQIKVKLEKGNYDKIMKKLRSEKAIERIVKDDDRLVIFVPKDDKVILRIIKIIESGNDTLVSLEVSDATLSEIFESLTKRITERK